MKAAGTLFLPIPLRQGARGPYTCCPYWAAAFAAFGGRRMKVELAGRHLHRRLAFRGDLGTAGSVMFLLELGELLEEWTHKKSVAGLAESLSLNVDRVWRRGECGDELVPTAQIRPGDRVVIRAGGMIPVDGVVFSGEASVNQASLTGESIPVAKRPGSVVYAGTVAERASASSRSGRASARAAMTASWR